MSDEVNKKKEILIRRGDTISYDSEKLYRNNIEIPKIDGEEECTLDRAKAKKQVFYDTFFRQSFKHIVILAAAGTSLDNGSNKGKTRDGLWEDGVASINKVHNILWLMKPKLRS